MLHFCYLIGWDLHQGLGVLFDTLWWSIQNSISANVCEYYVKIYFSILSQKYISEHCGEWIPSFSCSLNPSRLRGIVLLCYISTEGGLSSSDLAQNECCHWIFVGILLVLFKLYTGFHQVFKIAAPKQIVMDVGSWLLTRIQLAIVCCKPSEISTDRICVTRASVPHRKHQNDRLPKSGESKGPMNIFTQDRQDTRISVWHRLREFPFIPVDIQFLKTLG